MARESGFFPDTTLTLVLFSLSHRERGRKTYPRKPLDGGGRNSSGQPGLNAARVYLISGKICTSTSCLPLAWPLPWLSPQPQLPPWPLPSLEQHPAAATGVTVAAVASTFLRSATRMSLVILSIF